MVRSATGFVNSSGLTGGSFPARDRKRMVTSTISLGSAGPTSRDPSSGARSLPVSGRRFFGVVIDLLSIGEPCQEAESHSTGVHSRNPPRKGDKPSAIPEVGGAPIDLWNVAAHWREIKLHFVLVTKTGQSSDSSQSSIAWRSRCGCCASSKDIPARRPVRSRNSRRLPWDV